MTVSLAVFGPQSRAPTEDYLDSVRSFIAQHPVLVCILQNINSLNDVWELLSRHNPDIAALRNGKKYAQVLIEWLVDGRLGPAASISSGIVALPRLAIIQFTQYFQFLDNQGITHTGLVRRVRDLGGMQGYCGGLPAAVGLACARSEQELARCICTAVRVAFAIGLYAELGDDSEVPGVTTAVVRIKSEGQAEELVRMFPHTYISAITDPKSVSLVGPVKQMADLQAYAVQQGLQVHGMGIRGKTHNPENKGLAAELSALCEGSDLLRLPEPGQLQAPVRSNRTGAVLAQGSLTHEIVETVLASRCEWYDVLCNVASDLKSSGAAAEKHRIVSFGIGDCVPLMPFNKMGLQVTKTDWSGRDKEASSKQQQQQQQQQPQPPQAPPGRACFEYGEDAVAVVGASARLPGARDLHQLWELLSRGEDRHEELRRDRVDLDQSFRASQSGGFAKGRRFYGNFVEGVDRFDNAFFGVNPREALNMDPQQRVLLELAYEALESSGYARTHVRSRGDDVGCFIGASFVEYLDNTNAHPPTAYTSSGTIRAFLCGRLSYYFGWTGPAEVIDTACSSSLVAINRAVRAVRSGECSMALAGGINLVTGVNNFLDLAKAGFLSPTGQCKPFDASADGYCRAEGAGLVVLKPLRQARLDGDSIMGVIAGAATNQGGLSGALTLPSSDAQVRLYRSVLEQAGMAPDEVTYVEAHGTGTQVGDPLEVASIRSVFGGPSRATEVHIGSVKGNIGHAETAAGVAGLLKVLCMLEHQAIPPQASHRTWNPKIPALSPDRMAVSTTLSRWDAHHVPIRAALVNSYGAAGSNAAVLCCEAPQEPSRPGGQADNNGPRWPVVLSAQSMTSLERYRDSLVSYLVARAKTTTTPPPISDVAATLGERRRRHRHYAVFEAGSTSELISQLTAARGDGLARIALEQRASPPPVVLSFGGQSRQTVALDRAFYQGFPTFRATLDACDATLVELGYPPILPAVFDTSDLSDIVVLQTGFVAVQIAAATTWTRAGLRVAAVVGHSLGELAALAVSGRLSVRDCLALVAARARLMQTRWGPDKGAMLAIFAGRDTVAGLMASRGEGPRGALEVACYNSDTSQVVSGPREAVDALECHLASQSPPVRCLRVDTSHGFHSHLVDPILGDLDSIAQGLEWRHEATIPIELCTEAPTDPSRPYSPADHARKPVFFADAVRRLERALGGSCVFLEAGVNTPVMAMMKRAVAQSDAHTFVALSTTGKDSSGNTAHPVSVVSGAVAALWRSSAEVSHWSMVRPDCNVSFAWLPPYQFDPTPAWLENVDRAAALQSRVDQLERGKAEAEAGAVLSKRLPDESEQRRMVALPQPAGAPGQDTASGRSTTKRFHVSVKGPRFRSIVSGHAVRDHPLCPASLYLECVTMALSILVGDDDDIKNAFLEFQDLDIQAPLGAAGARPVEVLLEDEPLRGSASHGGSCWGFRVVSRGQDHRTDTLHARGRVARPNESKLETMARLVGRRMSAVASDAGAERMLARRAYGLFSRVVKYAPFLEGISSISMSGSEAVAAIFTQPGQPAVDDSTVVDVCDAVTLDSFIQVVGLLMNTSDMLGDSEVMVCTGITSTIISRGVNMVDCRRWEVQASYTPSGSGQAIGDVFAFAEDGSIAAAFTGCRFSKLNMARLERLLDAANQAPRDGKPAQPRAGGQGQAQAQAVVPVDPSMTASSSSSSSSNGPSAADRASSPPLAERSSALRKVLEAYTGLPAANIPADAALGDLGLDSLAATEMAEELQTSHQLSIDSENLLIISVGELEKKVLGSSAGKIPVPVPVPVPASTSRGPTSDTINGSAMGPPSQTAPARDGRADSALGSRLAELLVEVTGAARSAITPQTTLESIGVDSLALTEILSSLGELCASSLDTDAISLEFTVKEILDMLGAAAGAVTDSDDSTEAETTTSSTGSASPAPTVYTPASSSSPTPGTPTSSTLNKAQRLVTEPTAGLLRCEAEFKRAAASRGFQNYWSEVAKKQDALTLAYILEAFGKLGVDFASMNKGDRVPQVGYLTKHRHLFGRLQDILVRHGVVWRSDEGGNTTMVFTGDRTAVPPAPSSRLHDDFIRDYPRYAVEARLMALTGPRLAECLKGEADPVRLLFGSPSASKVLEEYYARSPMLSTMTSQLVTMITGSLVDPRPGTAPLRILEVGAGTGGTTAELAAQLACLGVAVEYTVTDISSTMVAKTRARFAQYHGWMSFERLDLEQPIPAHLQGRFDVVIGTNCVHATRDRVATTRRIREMLRADDGFVVLSEVTRVIDWYDIVFGLLEGWWLADGGASYPLQPPEAWMDAFRQAGFASATYSRGGLGGLSEEDANTQHLLVGSNRVATTTTSVTTTNTTVIDKMTVAYKEADGVPIEADIFFPSAPPAQPMPVALMVHGGGHMTLSRQAVRPAQTAHLLAHGVLPVSLDYRLCPEVNVIDGAMADVRDALVWARRTLPSIVAAAARGITVDVQRVVVVGWSTGGHLALSTAWTAGEAGVPPPAAILCFYAPVDFSSRDVFPRRSTSRIRHRLSRDEVLRIDVSGPALTHYNMRGAEDPELGWVKSGDARSELLLSMFREPREFGLALMLNGGTAAAAAGRQAAVAVRDLVAVPPTPERQAAMCPTARLRAGQYRVPTFIIHGEADEIALFESAAQFHRELVRQGVRAGFVAVPGGVHIHDLRLRPGMAKWEQHVAPGYRFLFDCLGCPAASG